MRAFICIVAFLVCACGGQSSEGVQTVATVAKNLKAWDGRIVDVRGQLGGCDGGFECKLIDPAAKDGDGFKVMLSVDYVPILEPVLGAAHGKEVLLRARVTDECADNNCTDRAADLVPIKVLKEY